MKKFLILLSLSFLLFSCAKFPSFFHKAKVNKIKMSEEFVQGSEDIPLLVDMQKIPEESLGFDSDSGSIMTSSYITKNDLENVQDFYLKTLPPMGWKVVKIDDKKTIFRREKEKLEIDFTKHNKKNIVKFFISSAL